MDLVEDIGSDGGDIEVELLKLVVSKPVGNSIESTSGTEDAGTSSTDGVYGDPSRLNSYCE